MLQRFKLSGPRCQIKNVIFLSCTLVGFDGTSTILVQLLLDITYNRYKLLWLIWCVSLLTIGSTAVKLIMLSKFKLLTGYGYEI
jgi:hypothetical protein